MSTLRSNSIRGWIALTAVLMLVFPLLAGDKKKTTKDGQQPAGKQRLFFDLNRIVWPNPPAIPRIKFQEIFTGEKFNPSDFEKKSKPKQGWMDRVAGAKSLEEASRTLPYQYIRTYGVAVDSKGWIYAADQGVDAIFITDPKTKEVQFIRNDHEAHFGLINGLAIDDIDRLFVSDSKLHRVFVFSAKHQLETEFGAKDLVDPGGIAIDKENRFVYVVDTQRDQVLVFDADNYKLLRTIGTAGKKHQSTEPGDFALPTHVAVDEEGDVYVTDTLNDRVEIFDADGNFLSTFGKIGDGPGHFERPKGIAIDSDGHIWVADAAQQRVKVFNRDGRLLIYFGQPGNYPGQFAGLYDIYIDKQNRVFTTEQYPGRVQMFQYVTDAEYEAEAKKREAEQSKPKEPAKKAAAPAGSKDSAAISRDKAWLRFYEARTDIGLCPGSGQQYSTLLTAKGGHSIMKRALLLVLLALVTMNVTMAAIPTQTNLTTDILGAHLVYGRGCIACHAPHSGSAGNGFNNGDANNGDIALWGENLVPLYGQTLKFGDAGGTVVTLPASGTITSAHDPTAVILFCLSCHDGNLAKPGMMKGVTQESFGVAGFGTSAPTFLGNDGSSAG